MRRLNWTMCQVVTNPKKVRKKKTKNKRPSTIIQHTDTSRHNHKRIPNKSLLKLASSFFFFAEPTYEHTTATATATSTRMKRRLLTCSLNVVLTCSTFNEFYLSIHSSLSVQRNVYVLLMIKRVQQSVTICFILVLEPTNQPT